MSTEASSWAWRQRLTATQKLVLLALADHADHEGICWPGMVGVAKKQGLGYEPSSGVSGNCKKLVRAKFAGGGAMARGENQTSITLG